MAVPAGEAIGARDDVLDNRVPCVTDLGDIAASMIVFDFQFQVDSVRERRSGDDSCRCPGPWRRRCRSGQCSE